MLLYYFVPGFIPLAFLLREALRFDEGLREEANHTARNRLLNERLPEHRVGSTRKWNFTVSSSDRRDGEPKLLRRRSEPAKAKDVMFSKYLHYSPAVYIDMPTHRSSQASCFLPCNISFPLAVTPHSLAHREYGALDVICQCTNFGLRRFIIQPCSRAAGRLTGCQLIKALDSQWSA